MPTTPSDLARFPPAEPGDVCWKCSVPAPDLVFMSRPVHLRCLRREVGSKVKDCFTGDDYRRRREESDE